MRITAWALAVLFAALAGGRAAAQGYLHQDGAADSSDEGQPAGEPSGAPAAAPAPAPEAAPAKAATPRRVRRRHRRARPVPAASDDESGDESAPAPRAADGKTAIADYLRHRLAAAEKNHHDQVDFGAKMGERWQKFFDDMYQDRKNFETSIARQRLNLFDTLETVGPDYRSQTVKDFEQMQSTMLKSFEESQRKKTDEFFGRLMEDVKSYAALQDQRRGDMLDGSLQAWKDEKALLDGGGKDGRDR